MLLTIDMNSDISIYTQIRNQVIKAIAKNQLNEGDSLPSVRQMATDLGVNLHTVNKAYNLLKQEGFLSIHRRKGVVINSKDSYSSQNEYFENLKDQLEIITSEAICRGLDYDSICSIIGEIISDLQNNERSNCDEQ